MKEFIFQGISSDPFVYVCPECYLPLQPAAQDTLLCASGQHVFHKEDGIWHFLNPERERYLERFIQEYETIRRREGRGAANAAYYRSLPFKDLSGRFVFDWSIRARSYEVFLDQVLQPYEAASSRPLKILDLGAGNGWLSNRLAERGHHVAAVDITTNTYDGLGSWVYYETTYESIQTEFDHLPLADSQFEVIVFNASFHYSTNYLSTLCESLRKLKPHGQLVILDTPVYHDPNSGLQMVKEREAKFQNQYGFPSNALPSENFLTDARLESLEKELGIKWDILQPNYGIRWKLKPWVARLRRQREPARFLVISGHQPPN